MALIRHGLAAGALLLVLGGCALWGEKETMRCPNVSVPPDAALFVRFNGPGRDLIDLDFAGEVDDVLNKCKFEFDEETGAGRLFMELSLVLAVERGTASTGPAAKFPYFVILTDAKREPIRKESFNMNVEFPENASRMTAQDNPVYLEVPLAKGRKGTDFEVFVGFQLDRAQLDFNRQRLESQR